MKLLSKVLVVNLLFLGAFLIFGLGKAEAATFAGETHSPTGSRPVCNEPGVPVDFSAYISNVSLNMTTGLISYNVGIGWTSCGDYNATRAYAIYSNSNICPLSGYYNGSASPEAYDCVKYIGDPPSYQGPSGLTCAWGTNEQCVTPFFNGVRRAQNGPPTTPFIDAVNIPMTYQIPNWGLAQDDNGSATVGGRMCQYFKTWVNYSVVVSDNHCLDLSLTVNWLTDRAQDNGSCSVSVAGGNVVQTGTTATVNYSATNSGGDIWPLTNGAQRYRLVNTTAAPWAGAPSEVNISGGGVENNPTYGPLLRPGASTTWSQPLTVPNTPGNYTFNWQIYGYSTRQGLHYVGPTCPITIKVELPTALPYFRVYGSDTVVGRQFKDSPTGICAAKESSSIIGYNKPAGAGWAGAGGQFAASASDMITNFMSASMHDNNTSTTKPPHDLSFGNYTGIARVTAGSSAGNDSTGYGNCILNLANPDIYTTIARRSDPSNKGAVAIGGTFPAGRTFPNGAKNIFYYNGNLTINDQVNASTSWSNLGDISSVIVIVNGNINIAPNVRNLDGLYFATGTIDTCSASGGPTVDACRSNQLVVNGAFVAREVKLHRLKGDLKAPAAVSTEGPGSQNIAEVFNFSPELYLTLGNLQTGIITKQLPDAIVGLPPIL